MDPKDKLEEDFEFYLSFFERNLKQLRDENDKALCQEWLQRLREMRGPRKRRRDRNVYLSQLALAMAEGRLRPPFDAPPPAEPAPLPSSLFGLLPPSAQVSETAPRNRSETGPPSSRADTSVKYWPNVPFGKEKSKWNTGILQTADEIVTEDSQTPVSEMSLLGIFDKGMNQMSETSFTEDESKWINDLLSRPSQVGSQNQLTLLSESSSLYSRFGLRMEQFSDSVTDEEKSTWSSDESLDADEFNQQTLLPRDPSLSSRFGSSTKDLSESVNEDEKKKQSNDKFLAADEFVSQNQQTLLSEGPSLYSRFGSSTKQLPERVNVDEKKKQSNDKFLAADEFPSTSRKPSAPQIGAPPSILSDDVIEEQSPKTGNKLGESKQSNVTVSTVGELELNSTNLSDFLPVLKIKPGKKLDQERPQLYSTNLIDSQINMFSKAMNRTKKRTDFQQPEFQSSNLFSDGKNMTSKDKFNPEKKLNLQRDKLHSTNFADSPTTVLFKAKFNMEKDLDRPNLHSTSFPDSRTNVFSKAKFNAEKDFDRPVVSRTCPHPSQMPLVLSGLESRLTVEPLVATQWKKFFEQDKDVSHGTSFESLLSYSKGQWLNKSWTRDSDSFMSVFSVLSPTTANRGEINRQSSSPSVHSEPRPPINQSEVIIQSLSLQSLQDESPERTPAISLTSMVSTDEQEDSLLPTGEQEDFPTPSSEQEDSFIPAGELKHSPMPAGEREHLPMSRGDGGRDQFTQTQSAQHLPPMPTGDSGQDQFTQTQSAQHSPPMPTGDSGQDQFTQTQSAQHLPPMPTGDSGQDQFTQTQCAQHLPQEKRFPEQPLYLPVYVISNQQPYFLYTPVLASQIEGHQFIIPTVIHLPNTPQQSE